MAIFDRGSDSDMAAGGSDLSWQQQHPDGGTISPAAARATTRRGRGVPVIALAVEHYNRMVRVLDKGVPVKVELNIETKFYDEATPNGFNTVAEIPGTDLSRRRSCCSVRTSISHPLSAPGATDKRDRQRRDDGGDADPPGDGAGGGNDSDGSGAARAGLLGSAPARSATTLPTSRRWR